MASHTPTTSRFRSARAMTLLEVLLAVLLLVLTIGVVMGAVSAMTSMETQSRKRLAAYEVANRIMLQYLDDDKEMPPKGLPIDYGVHRFFWELDETGATMVINRKQESNGANLQALDRFKLVGITVFEVNQVESFESKGEAIAFLSRVIDPANARNPDTLETFADPNKIGDLVRLITGGGALLNNGGANRSGNRLK